MRRCVIVWGPDFDDPGKAGIEAAQDHAEQLQEIAKQMPDKMAEQGADPKLVQAARDYIAHFRYAVRKVDL